MANQIDSSSINLSTIVPNQYFADYVPSPAPAQDTLCALPPLVSVDIQKKELIPLKPACSFTFPDVTVIPPFYNPPIVIPKVNIPEACEFITVKNNVDTCEGTDKSTLTLTASGPKKGPGANECSLTLEGLICVEACLDFEASSKVTFNGAAKDSSIDVEVSPAPDCGLTLTGDINVIACETFTANSDIVFEGANKGSFIAVEPSGAPDCGLTLTGIIQSTACETFSASTNVLVTGNAVKNSFWSLVGGSSPDCSVRLDGLLEIDACPRVDVFSNISIRHSNIIEDYSGIVVQPIDNNCGLVVHGVLDFKNVCESYKVIDSWKEDRAQNAKEIIESKRVEIPPPGAIEVLGNVVMNNSLRLVTQAYPECAIGITGNLTLDACKDFSLETETEGGIITVYGCDGEVGTIDLRPELIIEDVKIVTLKNNKLPANFPGNSIETTDGCRKKVKLKLNTGFISLCSSAETNSLSVCAGTNPPGGSPGGASGCSNSAGGPTCASTSTGGGGGAGGGGGGGGGCCCYHCDPARKCQTEMILKKLYIDELEQSPCCTEECKNTIDLCAGIITIGEVKTDYISGKQCPEAASNSYFDVYESRAEIKTFFTDYIGASANNPKTGGTDRQNTDTTGGVLFSAGTCEAYFDLEDGGGLGAADVYTNYIAPLNPCCTNATNYIDTCEGELYLANNPHKVFLSAPSAKFDFVYDFSIEADGISVKEGHGIMGAFDSKDNTWFKVGGESPSVRTTDIDNGLYVSGDGDLNVGSSETEFVLSGVSGTLEYRPRRQTQRKVFMDPEGILTVVGDSSDGSSHNLIKINASEGPVVSIRGEKENQYIELSAFDGSNWISAKGTAAEFYVDMDTDPQLLFKQGNAGVFRFRGDTAVLTVTNDRSGVSGQQGVTVDGVNGEVRLFDNQGKEYLNLATDKVEVLNNTSETSLMEPGTLTLTGPSGREVSLETADLDSGITLKFREVDVCKDGKPATAWVLMSEPKLKSTSLSSSSSTTT